VSGPLVDVYANDSLSRARLFGLQLNAEVDDLVESIGLDIDLDLMYTAGNEILPNNLGKLNAYRMSPRFMGQLNFSVNPWGKLYFSLRNIFTSAWYKRYLPLSLDFLESIGYPTKVNGYYTMDIIARYSFSRNLQAFFQLFNVLDAEYGGLGAYGSEFDLNYNPQMGRSFKLGFSFRLE
jgi:outer membrane receptor protein involved in Fe transport